jgi:prepilin-type N-terminal cleavage/methylation domain-containing protein
MNKSKGFTLIELAIVLMIIGLLIGGILKGQELINNARVNTVMRQVKAYEAAYITFQDSYGALAGDITNPGSRIPNCTTSPCNAAGDGNGRIGPVNTSSVPTATTGENRSFWLHLANANLISGISTSYTGTPNTFGIDFPTTALGGGYHIMYHTQAGDPSVSMDARAGHYLLAAPDATTINVAVNAFLFVPRESAQIDRKMDDGNLLNGNVIAWSILGSNCATSDYQYLESSNEKGCNLLFKLGN